MFLQMVITIESLAAYGALEALLFVVNGHMTA